MSGITRDEWLAALAEAGLHEDEHDPDAVTIDEFAAMVGLPRVTAGRRLEALVATGHAARTRKRTAGKDGRSRSLIAYRLTKTKVRKRA